MALICKKCGYRTEDNGTTNCPRCGAPMETELDPVAVPNTPGIKPYLAPIVLIVLVLAALIYLMSRPKGSSLFENMPKAPSPLLTAAQGDADAAESGGMTEPEEGSSSGVSTDPSGNEILTDYNLPGLDVQPEYVLAESARTSWTVSTQNDNLNMRSGPDTNYTIVGKLSEGTQVVGWGYSSNGPSNWIVVEYNGQYGWACTDYMKQN